MRNFAPNNYNNYTTEPRGRFLATFTHTDVVPELV